MPGQTSNPCPPGQPGSRSRCPRGPGPGATPAGSSDLPCRALVVRPGLGFRRFPRPVGHALAGTGTRGREVLKPARDCGRQLSGRWHACSGPRAVALFKMPPASCSPPQLASSGRTQLPVELRQLRNVLLYEESLASRNVCVYFILGVKFPCINVLLKVYMVKCPLCRSQHSPWMRGSPLAVEPQQPASLLAQPLGFTLSVTDKS